MLEEGIIYHVHRDHGFKNEGLFYRIKKLERSNGAVEEGSSWHSVPENLKDTEVRHKSMKEKFAGISDIIEKNQNSHIPDMLLDKLNCDMFDNVRPIKWVDPSCDEKYDMVVIGAGAGGLVTAIISASVGARTCIIERGFFGGDCLVTGCVPSKAFIKSASVAQTVKNAENFGIKVEGEVKIDFEAVMERVRRVRAQISSNDAAKRFTERYGMDVYLGHAKFTGKSTVSINGKELSFQKAVIATGARPKVPEIEGLDSINYYTSDNIFNLTK